jgi:hypothetical protein
MLIQKLNVEVIVVADEADPAVAELNAALDPIKEGHTSFGGAVGTVALERPDHGKRSALTHTFAAGETVADAARVARRSVTVPSAPSSDVSVLEELA